MSLACGFFNSEDGDREYFNQDLSNFLEGLVEDGIYEFIDDKMMVSASATPDMHVLVGKGRAWFNGTWTKIDAAYQVAIPAADAVLNRIDAICLTVNKTRAVRDNYIEIISGTGSVDAPTKPTVTNETDIYRHVLAYVTVPKGSTAITQAQIENRVGMGSALFSAPKWGNVPTTEEMVAQWQTQFDEFMDHIHETFDYDAAGHLQSEIDDLQTALNNISDTADTTPGGTAESTTLITSGAVNAGIANEATARTNAITAEATARNTAITQLRQDFTDGCNLVYNALVTAGVTPTAKTPDAFRTAMQSLFDKGRAVSRTVSWGAQLSYYWYEYTEGGYYKEDAYCHDIFKINGVTVKDLSLRRKTNESSKSTSASGTYSLAAVTPPSTSDIVRQSGETGWDYLARFLIKLGISVSKQNGNHYGPNSITNAIPNIKNKGQSYPTARSIAWSCNVASYDAGGAYVTNNYSTHVFTVKGSNVLNQTVYFSNSESPTWTNKSGTFTC